jgi:hypothetical protein
MGDQKEKPFKIRERLIDSSGREREGREGERGGQQTDGLQRETEAKRRRAKERARREAWRCEECVRRRGEGGHTAMSYAQLSLLTGPGTDCAPPSFLHSRLPPMMAVQGEK